MLRIMWAVWSSENGEAMVACMRTFAVASGATPRLPRSRATAWRLGAVLTLLITGVLYTALWAADTTWPDAQPWPSTNAAVAPRGPTLFVQGGLGGTVGSLVDVPLALDTAGAHVAALSFALDYDATCLALTLDDQDRNGLPDAIVIDAPTQFHAAVSVNPGGQQGQLSVMLVDYIPPLAALHDTAALMTIQFQIVCPLAPGLIDYAYVRFASTPAVGFSDNEGAICPGWPVKASCRSSAPSPAKPRRLPRRR